MFVMKTKSARTHGGGALSYLNDLENWKTGGIMISDKNICFAKS
jgi:hypothetical protein